MEDPEDPQVPGFNRLAAELWIKILEEYMTMCEAELKSPAKRLKLTLQLGMINTRTRRIVLDHASIWRTIHLQWRGDAVELFLDRSQKRGISLHLNTSQVFEKNVDGTNDLRWASFLHENMAALKDLDLLITTNSSAQTLSDALRTPAPHLQTFSLALGPRVLDCNENLFSNDAPNLRQVRLNTCLPWRLRSFGSLTDVTLRVGYPNCEPMLSELQFLPNAESIALTGNSSFDDVPALQTGSIAFSSCLRLQITKMTSVSVRRFFLSVTLPAVREVKIDESVSCQNVHLIPTTIVEASAAAPLGRACPKSIFLSIHPNRVVIATEGPFIFEYTSHWHKVQTAIPPGDDRILQALLEMITSFPTAPNNPVAKLIIHCNVCATAGPLTALTAIDKPVFWRRLFDAYPHITTLVLAGWIDEAVAVIRESENAIPDLSQLEIKQTNSETVVLLSQNLDYIRQARHLVEIVGPAGRM